MRKEHDPFVLLKTREPQNASERASNIIDGYFVAINSDRYNQFTKKWGWVAMATRYEEHIEQIFLLDSSDIPALEAGRKIKELHSMGELYLSTGDSISEAAKNLEKEVLKDEAIN